ncbi:protein kinase [Thermodesulfobacteriota bacterium]
MQDTNSQGDELARMWAEAELYESQGLYSHALGVYQNILRKEPTNTKARSKAVELHRYGQSGLSATNPNQPAHEEISPRQTLDLGIAYMGMSLYEEALDEFHKGLRSSPTVRVDILRQMTTCYVHLRKHEEAHQVLRQILADRSLTPAEKGPIIGETAALFIDSGLHERAGALIEGLTEQQRRLIPDYDDLAESILKLQAPLGRVAATAEDPVPGVPYEYAAQDRDRQAQLDSTSSSPAQPYGEVSVPYVSPIAYSLDSQRWHEGTLRQISPDWALVTVSQAPELGVTAVLRICLPQTSEDQAIWVVTRVVGVDFKPSQSEFPVYKLEFISYLSGGEDRLRDFVTDASADPSLLHSAQEPGLEPTISGSIAVFRALEEQALRAMEEEVLPERFHQEAPKAPPQPTPDPPLEAGPKTSEPESHTEEDKPSEEAAPAEAKTIAAPPPTHVGDSLALPEERAPQVVRFACVCGRVHIVPSKAVGRKGKCIECGREMRVPDVDPKRDSMSERVVGTVIGGCRILHKIGGGGMGGVFKGHHLGLDITVAVKILYAYLAEKDSVFIKRFIREARAAAKLQHPNIVGVMNVGYENGNHYIVMSYVGGGSAASVLDKIGRFSLERVVEMAIEVTKALTAAEDHNIMHRDIKPANILFTERGEVKLADLGLAKSYMDSTDSGITQTGIACGTPLYFSPEQAKGAQDLDIRSDIYSLGITLYHLLEGSPPFIGESAFVIFQQHVHDKLPPFRRADPPVPETVFRILQKMTEKSPGDRFQSSRELLDVLESLKEEIGISGRSGAKKGLLERLGIKKHSS